jgi:hypothetical protein
METANHHTAQGRIRFSGIYIDLAAFDTVKAFFTLLSGE